MTDLEKEQVEILREFNLDKAMAFHKARNAAAYEFISKMPSLAALAGMHKTRLSMPAFTEEEKAYSRAWLVSNGFKPT